jgi:hypothetical protein
MNAGFVELTLNLLLEKALTILFLAEIIVVFFASSLCLPDNTS